MTEVQGKASIPAPPMNPPPSFSSDTILKEIDDHLHHSHHSISDHDSRSQSEWNNERQPKSPRGSILTSVRESARNFRQTSTRQAAIALWEREMRIRKEKFGTDLFPIMEGYRNCGEKGGGETEPRTAALFQECHDDITKLLIRRKDVQAELNQRSKADNIAVSSSSSSAIGTHVPTPQSPMDDSSVGSSESASNTSVPSSPVTPSTRKSWLGARMQKAKEVMGKKHVLNRLKLKLHAVDREISERQKRFGVQIYDVMTDTLKNYEPRDPTIREMLGSTKNDISIPLAKTKQAEKEIDDVKTIGEICMTHPQIYDFISSTPMCWSMLQKDTTDDRDSHGVDIDYQQNQGNGTKFLTSKEDCVNIAYELSLELTTGKVFVEALTETITKNDFEIFLRNYINDPEGSQEFFRRCQERLKQLDICGT